MGTHMKIKHVATAALGAVAFCFGGSHAPLSLNTAYAQSEGVRPAVGTPLNEAAKLIKAGKPKDALVKLREAEAVSGRTGAENFLIEGMRLAAASAASEPEPAVKAFEALKASGKYSQADQLRAMEAIAGAFYRAGNYSQALSWSQRYVKEGGTSGSVKQIMSQSQFLSGDMTATIREITEELHSDERTGRTPSEDRIKLLLNAGAKKGDQNAVALGMEKLLAYYPKKEYWADVISRVQRKSTFSDRLGLDINRLQLATGGLKAENDYMEYAQTAVQAGFPLEGKSVMDKGFAAGVLGAGAGADRQKRLRDLINKKVEEDKAGLATAEATATQAKDGNALVNVGFNYVLHNQGAKGIKLMEEGIAKGGLKRPEDARLHLGLAYALESNNTKAQAQLKQVKGTDGVGDISRLWSIYLRNSKLTR